MARLAAPFGVVGIAFVLLVGLAQAGAAADGELRAIGTFSLPVYVTAPPGDGERLFVVEQAGRIRVVHAGTVLSTPFLDITGPVVDGGERGLLSIAFAPDYAVSGLFYAYYTVAPSGDLRIAEFRRSSDPNVADAGSERPVLTVPHPTYANHNGGQLQFGADGYLYIATGDGGGGGDPFRAAQRLDDLRGKILRINPRLGANGEPYTIPADNPFGSEIWAYGLRNPWRFSFDRQTGDLTVGDVGQGAWEEVDFVPAASGAGRGANFGWSCWEGRHEYQPNYGEPACAPARAAHTRPVLEYPHPARGCSVTGGYVVRDPALSALHGRYVYGDYCDDRVWSVSLQVPDAQDNRDTGLTIDRLTSFGEDACGRIYAVSHAGPVYRLAAPGAPGADTCTPTSGPAPPPPPPGSPPPQPQPQPPASPAPQPARPTARCRVPRVIGLRTSTARARVRRANCRVGRIRYRHSTRRRGRVLTQAPRAGARRPRGAAVRFTVSRGRR